ncbi:MAG: ABC transporter ATP-binding protein [bacterium]|nr:ABC transporter ATP-binding protein [bacterium]
MWDIIYKINKLLTKKERTQMLWLMLAILIMAFFEVVGIAAIVPFMQVVANPEIIKASSKLFWLYNLLHFTDSTKFLFFLGRVVLSLLVFSIAFTAFTNWLLLRFTYMRGYTLGRRLFTKYLGENYEFFLSRNSSELTGNILSEITQMISGVLVPGMQLVAKAVVALFILSLLLLVDPLLAMTGGGVICVTYAIFYMVVKGKLKRIGKARLDSSQARFKIAAEGFGGIKEVKLIGAERVFVDRFSVVSEQFARYQALSQTVAQFPRYVIEAIMFGGVLVLILYLLATKQDLDKVLPLISLYIFAGYRLVPALQQIFAGLTTARFYKASLDFLYKDLGGEDQVDEDDLLKTDQQERLPFLKEVRMENITFTYGGCAEPVINDVNITIKAKSKVAFVGKTGSGKTTVIDILLGLLRQQKGSLTIDGTIIDNNNVLCWQKNVGYVPQNIFLADDSIIKNIAFGIPDALIDRSAVEKAAKIANIHDFIINDVPKGYQALIGERGVRLSGGQRQRIGIARALYRDPEVLIFDEATNALDGVTEEAVIQAIKNLSVKKTIIMIAHRLSTVKDSDLIYVLDKGKLIGKGKYEDLVNSCAGFDALVKAGS